MLISSRSSDFATESGICDRSRPGACSGEESTPSTSPPDPLRTLSSAFPTERALVGGDQSFESRSDVRNDDGRVDGNGHRFGASSNAHRSLTAMQRRMLAAIEWYQGAFAWRPSPCRFTPTCSHYAHEAIERHGSGHGLWLSIRRLLRCRPFGPSGFDPVPDLERNT